MSALEHMAARVAGDPLFLASVLADYARSEALDDAGLAAKFGLTADQLTRLKLCRVPRPTQFAADVATIARRFALDANLLAVAIHRGQSVARLRAGRPAEVTPGFLLAARDQEAPPPPPEGEGTS
jgi:hypothetical protein